MNAPGEPMACAHIRHALRQMFARSMSVADVRVVIQEGTCIRDYPDDAPYPSGLMLGFAGTRPVHAVVARDLVERRCIVVTAYEPDPALWTDDFTERRKP